MNGPMSEKAKELFATIKKVSVSDADWENLVERKYYPYGFGREVISSYLQKPGDIITFPIDPLNYKAYGSKIGGIAKTANRLNIKLERRYTADGKTIYIKRLT